MVVLDMSGLDADVSRAEQREEAEAEEEEDWIGLEELEERRKSRAWPALLCAVQLQQ